MKGMVVDKGKGYAVLLTPQGEYKRIKGSITQDIGEDVHIPRVRSVKVHTALAASLLVLILLQSIFRLPMQQVTGYVTVAINPSIEFGINGRDRVIAAQPFNDEAAVLLASISYRKKAIEEVLAEFTHQAVDHHYIEQGRENRVVITIAMMDGQEEMGARERRDQRIAKLQQEILKEAGQEAVVEIDHVSMQVREEARQVGVSPVGLDASKQEKHKVEGAKEDTEGEKEDTEGKKEATESKNNGKGNQTPDARPKDEPAPQRDNGKKQEAAGKDAAAGEKVPPGLAGKEERIKANGRVNTGQEKQTGQDKKEEKNHGPIFNLRRLLGLNGPRRGK